MWTDARRARRRARFGRARTRAGSDAPTRVAAARARPPARKGRRPRDAARPSARAFAGALARDPPRDARPAAGGPPRSLLYGRPLRAAGAAGLPQARALSGLSLRGRDDARHAAPLWSPHRSPPRSPRRRAAADRARARSRSSRRQLGMGGVRSKRARRARRMVGRMRDPDRVSDQRRKGAPVRRVELRARPRVGPARLATRWTRNRAVRLRRLRPRNQIARCLRRPAPRASGTAALDRAEARAALDVGRLGRQL